MDEGLNYLQSFNPVESKAELLEKTLIGRKDLVDLLEKLVIESATSGNMHQRLMIGPRGSGKTHLLRVLYNRISKRKELKNKLTIAYLCEDEYGIATFLDLIIRIFRAFIKWDPEKSAYLSDEINKLKKVAPHDREKIAVNTLLNHMGKKTLLIIIENIADIFTGMEIQGQRKLRDLVQQHPCFTIMASNQALFQDIQYEDKPFHNFFKITHLKKLTLEEAVMFLKSIAEWEEKTDLLQFLNSLEGKGRIHAIYNITSGNHRLMVTFYQFLKVDYKNDLSYLFMKTINDLIPYYQSFMDKLSALQQKIIQYLCQTRTPASVKDIAENCFSTHNTISKQITNLVRLKYVDTPSSSGRETFYELSDPLLRICFEVKENRGGPVMLFIDFLSNLYSIQKIKNYMEESGDTLEYPEIIQFTSLFEQKDSPFLIKETAATYGNSGVIELIEKHKFNDQFFKAFPHAIFNILIHHEEIEEKRFEFIETILNQTFKENTAMILPLKFLNIGIRHLKKKEKNALLQFTKEERNTFNKFVMAKRG
jgi:hypothetical protein